ncbi:MAG: aromatic ring-hydroxylating dioxygenase subunit alpha [Gammaproteobacteria bacterium]|nr:aromatic ring-hydroxylating dioxygenase subunit alpha [Gammaproteobacteria bacterium]
MARCNWTKAEVALESTQDPRLMALAERALSHYVNKTTDRAPTTMQMPVSAYSDTARYDRERKRIFGSLPIAVALSIELPDRGSYKAMQVLDVPLLLVRDEQGVARCFLNVCRHRGARLCESGRAQTRIIACPYHAWTYNLQGELVARYGADSFGEITQQAYSLTALPCEERAGFLWVSLDQTPFDIDQWLGDFAVELGTLALQDWHIYAQRELPGPGWKVTMDGYLEAYHHNMLHGQTVGQMTVGNLMVLDTYGPHQRLTFGRKSLGELARQPRKLWRPQDHIRLIHSGFPNLSVSGIVGGFCLVSQIFPGPTAHTTLTVQTVLCAKPPQTDAEIASAEDFSAMVLQAVKDEDYPVGFGVQEGILSQANTHFTFGRNESALQNYHRWVAHFMGEEISQ